jgi:hypothetical protein
MGMFSIIRERGVSVKTGFACA